VRTLHALKLGKEGMLKCGEGEKKQACKLLGKKDLRGLETLKTVYVIKSVVKGKSPAMGRKNDFSKRKKKKKRGGGRVGAEALNCQGGL